MATTQTKTQTPEKDPVFSMLAIQAIKVAMLRRNSCVLFYGDIYDELYRAVGDADMFKKAEEWLYEVMNKAPVTLGRFTIYKIYTHPDDSAGDIFVILKDEELTEYQQNVLRTVASLYDMRRYDVYNEDEDAFYEAMPNDRLEVYTTLHNLVKMWTSCHKTLADE